MSEIEQSAAEL